MSGPRVILEADGGSRGNPGPAGYGAVLRDADTGEVLREVAAGIGVATNNVAEYDGLLAGLRAAAELDASSVDVRMDSKLVIEQMAGRWQVKHPDMKVKRREAAGLVAQLPQVTFTHIPRAQNSYADRLANAAMDAAAAGREWEPAPEPASSATTAPTSGPSRGTGWFAPTSPPTTTVLLRHGQTPLSVERRFSGVGDPELTAYGEQQAAAAAARLAETGREFGGVVTSPLRRARQTAGAVAVALGVDTVVEDGLRETDFGDWEGYTFAEVREKWPAEMEAWLRDQDVAPPHGESFAETARRVRRARDRLLSTYPGQPLVVVSHVTPIKQLLRMALEAPPVALYRIHLDLTCLSEIDWYASGPAVVRSMNDTAHVPLPPPGAAG